MAPPRHPPTAACRCSPLPTDRNKARRDGAGQGDDDDGRGRRPGAGRGGPRRRRVRRRWRRLRGDRARVLRPLPRGVRDQRLQERAGSYGGGGLPAVRREQGDAQGGGDDGRERVVQAGDRPGPPGGDLRGGAGQEPRPELRGGGGVPRPRPRAAHQQQRHQAAGRPLRQPHRLLPQGPAPGVRPDPQQVRPQGRHRDAVNAHIDATCARFPWRSRCSLASSSSYPRSSHAGRKCPAVSRRRRRCICMLSIVVYSFNFICYLFGPIDQPACAYD